MKLTSKWLRACLFTDRPQLCAPHFKHSHNVRSYSNSLFSDCKFALIQSRQFSASKAGNLNAFFKPFKSTAVLMWLHFGCRFEFGEFSTPDSDDVSVHSCGLLCRFFLFTILWAELNYFLKINNFACEWMSNGACQQKLFRMSSEANGALTFDLTTNDLSILANRLQLLRSKTTLEMERFAHSTKLMKIQRKSQPSNSRRTHRKSYRFVANAILT